MAESQCPPRDQLVAYSLGKLDPQTLPRIADHLATCACCAESLAQLATPADTLFAAVRDTPSPAVNGPPSVIGNYRLIEELGEGGMGVVYKALHIKLDKLVALKVLVPQSTDDPQRIARFEQEMKAVGRLEDPYLVRAMDAGQFGQRLYLAMEYIEGLNLAEVLARVGPLRIADACEMIRQTALGLKAIDAHGLVHRDIKPSNLMLNADGCVKILDLGVALFASGGEGQNPQVVGTPDYMAPEQIEGRGELDIRADLYGLGCTLCKLLTGEAPFPAPRYQTAGEKLWAHCHREPEPLSTLRSDVPAKLAALAARLLAKDPALRVPDPGQLAEALRAFCGGADLAGVYARATAAKSPETGGDASRVMVPVPLARAPVAETGAAGAPGAKPEDFDPYRVWLGIPPAEQPPHHYRLLAIPIFEDDRPVIEAAVARQSAYLRTLQLGEHLKLSQKLLNEVGAAKVCLLIPEKKAAYDARLKRELGIEATVRNQGPGARDSQTPPRPQLPPKEDRGEGTPESGSRETLSRPVPVLPIPHPPSLISPPRQSPSPRLPRTPIALAVGSVAAVIVLAVILWIRADSGTMNVEPSDAAAEVDVKVDDRPIAPDSLGVLLPRPEGEHKPKIETTASPPLPPAADTTASPAACEAQTTTTEPTRLDSGMVETQVEKPLAEAGRPPGKSLPAPAVAAIPLGDGVQFDGQASYVDVPTLRYDGSYPITVEAIVSLDDDRGSCIVGDTEFAGIDLSIHHSRFYFQGFDRAAQRYIPAWADNPVTPARRVHLAGILAGSDVTLFVNGKRQSHVGHLKGGLRKSPLHFTIGASPHPSEDRPFDWPFAGIIHAVRISKIARFRADFSVPAILTPDDDTLLAIPFDEGQGELAHDASGHANHGYLRHAQWILRRTD